MLIMAYNEIPVMYRCKMVISCPKLFSPKQKRDCWQRWEPESVNEVLFWP